MMQRIEMEGSVMKSKRLTPATVGKWPQNVCCYCILRSAYFILCKLFMYSFILI